MNNLVSQLNQYYSGPELLEQLKVLPPYRNDLTTIPERLMALLDIYKIFIPNQTTIDIYNRLYLSLVNSLDKKNTLLETQLSKDELKKFYLILVHYWNDYKYFISPQSFLRFWIRVNSLCAMIDKDFPNPRKKPKELKLYCQQHPYYFIDKLRHELVVNLFCQHLEDRLDLLIHVAQKIKTEDLDSIEVYLDKALALV